MGEVFPYETSLIDRFKLLFKPMHKEQHKVDKRDQGGSLYVVNIYYKEMNNKRFIIKKKLVREFR